MVSVVNAATGSLNLATNVDKVKAGEEFTVTIVGTADGKIAGLSAVIEYKEENLEITGSTLGNKKFHDYNDELVENQITIGSSMYGSEEDFFNTGALYTVKFKVKEGVQPGEETITFKNIVLTILNDGNQEDIDVAEESIEITIEEEKQEEQPPVEEPDNNQGQQEPPKDNTSTGKLPQTGVESTSLIAIVLLGVVAIVSYVSYRRYRNI